MAVVQLDISELYDWVYQQPDNTIDTPYEIEVINVTSSTKDRLRTASTIENKYIDYRPTTLEYGCLPSFGGAIYLVYPPSFSENETNVSFSNCRSLKAVNFSCASTSFSYTFNDCTSLEMATINAPSVVSVSDMFWGCTALDTVSLNIAATNGGSDISMQFVRNIRNVTIETTATKVSTYNGRANCEVVSITGDNITEISLSISSVYGDDITLNTPNLTKLSFIESSLLESSPVIPNSVTDMSNCFYGCSSLITPPVIPNNVTNMYRCFCGCTSLTSVSNIPSTTTDLTACFYECTSLVAASVNIQNTSAIVANMFLGCTSLKELEFICATTTTETQRFIANRCTALENAFISINTTGITDFLGPDLSNLKNLYYENSAQNNLGSLGNLFNGITGLSCDTITLKLNTQSQVSQTLSELFYYTETLNIEALNLETSGQFLFACTSTNSVLKNINMNIPKITGLKFDYNLTALESVTGLHNGLVNLNQCFAGLTHIQVAPHIPETVTNLSSCFNGCTGLVSVENIPRSVTNLTNCFKNCSSLTEIRNFNADLSSISTNNNGADCFYGCTSLSRIVLNGKAPEEDSNWHVYKLVLGDGTVTGKVFDKNGTTHSITSTAVNKANIKLPFMTDELWFPTMQDTDIESAINNMIQYKYGVFNKIVIPPNQKNMVLWADDKDNFVTNLDLGGGSTPVDVVQSGNMNPVTSNAVANYDPVSAKGYKPKKLYTIDATSLSTSYLYPVTFAPTNLEIDCEIHSPGYGASASYNQNVLHFLSIQQGWSDTPKRFLVLEQGAYDVSEITIGSVWRGTQNGVTCVYVRGGYSYTFIVNAVPTLRTSNYTYNNEVYNVSTSRSGSCTNAESIWNYSSMSNYEHSFAGKIQGTISNADVSASCSGNAATASSCSGNSASANYLTTYSADGNNNIQCLQNVFNSIPKSVGTAIRLQHGSHSMAVGWFLSGYSYSSAYGGWFVSNYGSPSFVGIDNGSWHEEVINTNSKTIIPIGGSHSTNGEIWIES